MISRLWPEINKQFGFQSNKSTEHAILNLVDDISNAFDRGEFTLGIQTYQKLLIQLIIIFLLKKL